MTSLVLKVVIIVALLRQDVEGDDACVCYAPWGEWTRATPCTVCNVTVERLRVCYNPFGNLTSRIPCFENDTEICPCPVHGGWGMWSSAGCSVTCGVGRLIIRRACDSPAPRFQGDNCSGDGTMNRGTCIKPACPTQPSRVHGGWGMWSSAGCSVTCGVGRLIIRRECDNPAPRFQGDNCSGDGTMNRGTCRKPACPTQPSSGHTADPSDHPTDHPADAPTEDLTNGHTEDPTGGGGAWVAFTVIAIIILIAIALITITLYVHRSAPNKDWPTPNNKDGVNSTITGFRNEEAGYSYLDLTDGGQQHNL